MFKKKEYLKTEVEEYNQVAQCSDAIVCLSGSYLTIFQKLINTAFHKKLFAINNPIELFNLDKIKKKKQILYVGRLEFGMKRFDRMINIWAKIEKLFPDWSFIVVGDGPYRGYFENSVHKKGLKNVHFEGFQNPVKYYSESSIICLSSSTEGFPMVLVEALKYKCIPIAYNSFAALSDIIVDGVNGYAIPPFKEKLFIEKLHYLMSNENERNRLASNNAVTLGKLDIDIISQQWFDLFDNLLN
ncbi:MAG: glycosyltransferase [Candidatus Aphodosoma sp.]